jgi:diguanylate cyclase (GGDEF)-like protein/PAS domain S-box-containing protein
MYALTTSPLFESRRDFSEGFSAALDFALSADEFFDLYNNAPCGYHSLDANGLFLRINNTELRWLGYTRDEVVGRMHITDILAPEFRETYERKIAQLTNGGDLRNAEFRLRCKDGALIDISLESTALYSDTGDCIATRSRVLDISDRKRSENGLRDQEQFIERLLLATPGIVYIVDVETRRTLFATHRTGSELGYTPAEIEAMGDARFDHLVHPDDVPKVAAHIMRVLSANDKAVVETEYRMRRADGTYSVFATRDVVFARNVLGEVTQFLGIAQDVTETRSAQRAMEAQTARLKEFALRLALQRNELEEANRRLHTLAYTDELTMLPNHRVFQERLRAAFENARQNDSPLSLLLIDLDFFKEYNDSYGHPAGDDVLRAVASVLSDAVPEGDLCARYGGGEFAILLQCSGAEPTLRIAEQIRAAVEAIPAVNRPVTACIGLSSYRPDMDCPASFIREADAAMCQAKRNGRNQVHHADSVPKTYEEAAS